MTLTDTDLVELQAAKTLLEHPGLAIRMTNLIGTPLEKALAMLPKGANDIIAKATHKALETALGISLATLNHQQQLATNGIHKIVAGLSGAAGGALGLPALAIELPVSTAIILRSIADIARSEGEDLTNPATQLACLEVFALGGDSQSDNAAESGYFAIRAALAKSITEATHYIAASTMAQQTAPPLVRMISQIAARFGIPVTQKAIAQSVPIMGAAGGALINTLFIDHFQNMSRGHFIVRRLERKYGTDLVKQAYLHLHT